jgi:hypothetical protein
MHRFSPWFLFACLCAASVGATPARPEDELGRKFFQDKIGPVLEKNCYKCHSAKAEEVKGHLLLDTRDGIRKGGDNGPAIVPGEV